MFQFANANNILASIAGICDNGNTVTFTDSGGFITNTTTGRKTTSKRKGNVYVMDMWVRNPGSDNPKAKASGFARPER